MVTLPATPKGDFGRGLSVLFSMLEVTADWTPLAGCPP
jgi:hypothetical protein